MQRRHDQKQSRKDAQTSAKGKHAQTEMVKLGALSGAGKKRKPMTKGQKITMLITAVVAVLLIGGTALLWLTPEAKTMEWYPRLGKTAAVTLLTLGGVLLVSGFAAIRRAWMQIVAMVMSAVLLVSGSLAMYFSIYWRDIVLGEIQDNISQGPAVSGEDVGVNSSLPDTVFNIALFGLDNRSEQGDDGRSDAITILSVDFVHNKIKLTSIARDIMVTVDGYNNRRGGIQSEDYAWSTDADENYAVLMNARKYYWTKITHAFTFGAGYTDEDYKKDTSKCGPGAAMKALNENFGLNIEKYVFVNFYEFAEIVDLVGGVEINIEQREINKLNENIRHMDRLGLKAKELTRAGKQNLTGGQALAYARLRKTDTDIQRGNRQKAVIDGVLAKAKKMSVLDYPELIRKVLSICNTNMTAEQILEIAEWVVNEEPKTENFSMPDDDCQKYSWDSYQRKNSDAFKSFGSVYVLDLDYASAVMKDFIYETNEAKLLTPNIYTWPQAPDYLEATLRKQAEKKASEAAKNGG